MKIGDEPWAQPPRKTLVVFSHPNHELAVFGLLQRIKPDLVFLTDGGGEHRVEETRKGLRSIGLLDQAVFLNHSEESFYNALLRMDASFFGQVASQVGDIIRARKPYQILCDAVEFYNPVHDMTLAILSNVIEPSEIGIYEVPLLYQKPGVKGEFGVQTVPDSQTDRIECDLTAAETASKKNALETIYTILRDTLGAVLLSSPMALKKETVFPASSPLRWPDAGRVLRYDRRAGELKAAGKVKDVISHEPHYITVVSHLLSLAAG